MTAEPEHEPDEDENEDDEDEDEPYHVTVYGVFIADDEYDAVRQMVEHLQESAHTMDYEVTKDGWAGSVTIDAEIDLKE